jgi:hypothetical protein
LQTLPDIYQPRPSRQACYWIADDKVDRLAIPSSCSLITGDVGGTADQVRFAPGA